MHLKFLPLVLLSPDNGAGDGGGGDAGGHDAGGGDGGFDFSALQGELEATRREAQMGREAMNELQRLRKAFTGEDKEDKQPKGKWADPLIEALLEADRQGKKMPLTAQNILKTQEHDEFIATLREEIRKQQAELERLKNPAVQQDRRAYENMEAHLENTLETIYGEIPNHIYDAVATQISNWCLELRQAQPEAWERVRRNPELQKKIVQKACIGVVPQQARQLVSQQYESQQPLTKEDFQNAWAEADEIKDPTKRAQVKALLRQEFLQMTSPILNRQRRR